MQAHKSHLVHPCPLHLPILLALFSLIDYAPELKLGNMEIEETHKYKYLLMKLSTIKGT